jgi:hypothetical protein
MAYENTYVALDKVTISGSSTSTVTFSSIPSTYTDLVLVENYSLSTLAQSILTFNGSTSSFSNTNLYANGTSAFSSRFTATGGIGSSPGVGDAANQQNVLIRNIQNYSNSTTFKTVIQRRNDASASVWATVGLWGSTAPITSITLSTGGGVYNAGTTFCLYGVAATGSNPAAKASGGTISYSADGYTYHTFTSSGTFTPSTALTVEALVVAGGGGGAPAGGVTIGGGGGAGGVCYHSAKSLSATAYTVTVGAGASGGQTGSNQAPSGSNSVFFDITANGGGGGGAGYAASSGAATGANGGSGGGGGSLTTSSTGTGGTSNQSTSGGATGYGFAGGTGTHVAGSYVNSGGGGGAGAVGQDGGIGNNSQSGNGGIGLNTWLSWTRATATGDNGYFAGGGGGGGGNGSGTQGLGGLGGGARGGWTGSATQAPNALVNTGGGGGGGPVNSGAGGSGVVIVRYPSV